MRVHLNFIGSKVDTFARSFHLGKCHANDSLSIVQKECLGQNSCLINATTATFGDPCYGTVKHLSVQVSIHRILSLNVFCSTIDKFTFSYEVLKATCTKESRTTSWDFSVIDPMTMDFMNATEGHDVVINFSTTPEWMWNSYGPVQIPDDPDEVC
jgi:hypothetical protein